MLAREFYLVVLPLCAGLVGLWLAGLRLGLWQALGFGHAGGEVAFGVRRVVPWDRLEFLGAVEPFAWILLGAVVLAALCRLLASAKRCWTGRMELRGGRPPYGSG